ncbi:MAG: hypothetical protein RI932_817 [Pseudomonadota bacterium]|jgi:hypothetical protein
MNFMLLQQSSRLLLTALVAALTHSAWASAAQFAQSENPTSGEATSSAYPSTGSPGDTSPTPSSEKATEPQTVIVPEPLSVPASEPAPEPASGEQAEPGEKKDASELSKRRTSRRTRNQKFAVLTPAPASLAGKNLPFGVGLGWRQKLNNESDLLTGLRSNQMGSGLTWESQFFIPHMKDLPLLNMFGLGFGVDFDFPYQIVGRDLVAGETQTLEWSALGFQVSPIAQTYLQKSSLSRVWLQPFGYAYRSAKLKVNSGTENGAATLTLLRKGFYSVMGGEYSFFPYFHTGGEMLLGWGQTWNAEDGGTAEKREGEWNYFEPRLLVSLRYPTRKSFVSIFNLSIMTGVSMEFFKSKSPDVNFPGRRIAALLGLKLGWQFQPPASPVNAGAR